MSHADIAHAIAVNFNMCFWDSADGSEFVVRAVATSRMIEDIIFLGAEKVGMSWNALEGHSFPKLRVANFENFFDDQRMAMNS